jgi:hypothetical protein
MEAKAALQAEGALRHALSSQARGQLKGTGSTSFTNRNDEVHADQTTRRFLAYRKPNATRKGRRLREGAALKPIVTAQ